MNFILYSAIDEGSIGTKFGMPEYSYYFLVKAFQGVLAELGTVTVVKDPVTEVEPIFAQATQRGESCVFLSFSPPHKTSIELVCPTVSVFAWEFSNVPNETWDDDARHDWRNVFACHGRTVTMSSYAARAVREAMGDTFPVLAVPAPIWDRFAAARARTPVVSPIVDAAVTLRGTVTDSLVTGFSADRLIEDMWWPGKLEALQEVAVFDEPIPEPLVIEDIIASAIAASSAPQRAPRKSLRFRLGATKRHLLAWYHEVVFDLLPAWMARTIAIAGHCAFAPLRLVLGPRTRPSEVVSPELIIEAPVIEAPAVEEVPLQTLSLSGVVYTSVFGPTDGRKNWSDMVSAFVWAFREVEDATLVLKMTQRDKSSYEAVLTRLLAELSPFKCRVIALHAFLDDTAYEALIEASTYYVNSSVCEGLCLPLMEFMSCGRPAISPSHTAMEDYIDPQAAFVVKSSVEHNVWPHDSRDLFRTLRYRISWESLRDAYRESYRVAKADPQRYTAMSRHALATMQAYCSDAVVTAQLREFFCEPQAPRVVLQQAESHV